MRLTLASLALILSACPGRGIDTPAPDGGLCEGMVCAEGQRCRDGVCVADDLCSDVVCADPSEVCDPRDGSCRPGATDSDGDGFTIAGGDCDDGASAVFPGAEEVCDGVDQDCDLEIDELPPGTCTTACGTGEVRCIDGEWVCSVPETCGCDSPGEVETEPCGHCGTRSRSCVDWEWSDWSECEGGGECTPGSPGDCTTRCGSVGTTVCGDDCRWGACETPTETCNGVDDDCDGDCDEGCRHRVYRCHDVAAGAHYYTTTAGECESWGYEREAGGDFYLYTTIIPGTADFWHCRLPGAPNHFYTTSDSCDGSTGWSREESIGGIGDTGFCGGTGLFRLHRAHPFDFIYTTRPEEVTLAESLGYVFQGASGFVWLSE